MKQCKRFKIEGSVRHPPDIFFETCTRNSPYAKMMIGDVIDWVT